MGITYHNFHQEFPSNYLNAIDFRQYDRRYGLSDHEADWLVLPPEQIRQNESETGLVKQLQKKLDQKRSNLHWDVPLEQLLFIGWEDYVDQAWTGQAPIAIASAIYDVTDVVKNHA